MRTRRAAGRQIKAISNLKSEACNEPIRLSGLHNGLQNISKGVLRLRKTS